MRRSYPVRDYWFLKIPVVLALLSAAFLIAPLIGMFANLDRASIASVFAQESLGLIVFRTVFSSFLVTVLSVVLAYLLAWCMERTAVRGKKWFRTLVTIPMLIPSVSIGMGVVLLGGNNGVLTNLLGLHTGSIYGLAGIVWGSVLYAFPVAFLMIDNVLRLEDSTQYEAAKVLGLSRWKQFWAITVPYLKKPLIVVAFSVFTLSFTDYGVPLMVGGKYKTLAMVMYQEVIGQLAFGKGCVYGSMLLIPAVIAFVLDYMNQSNANAAFVTRPFIIRREPLRDTLAAVYAVLAAVSSILPIIAFILLAFVKKYPSDMTFTLQNVGKTLQMGGGKYLLNSVCIALLVSVFGVLLTTVSAYFTARTKTRFTRVLHLMCMSMAAIPGVVLGLAYVLLFKGTFVYNTLAILVMVNTVHFFASPYLMMYTSMSKINLNLEGVTSTLGISRFRLLTAVLIPQCMHTIRESFSFFFVNCMMTISAVSFLANTRTKPVALMINQFEAQAQMECAAVVSLAILLVNVIVKGLLERSGKGKTSAK